MRRFDPNTRASLAHRPKSSPLRDHDRMADEGSRKIVGQGTTLIYKSPAGPLAHRVEQGTFNPKVPGSSPGRPTMELSKVELVRVIP